MSAESRAVEVLAEHVLRETDPACACGWDWDWRRVILPSAVDFDSSRYRLPVDVRPEQHRAHVAAALAAAGCLADDREGETVTEWGVVIDDLGSTDMAESQAQARAWLANGDGRSLVRVVTTEWPVTPDGGDQP